jgi:hypothetical protein
MRDVEMGVTQLFPSLALQCDDVRFHYHELIGRNIFGGLAAGHCELWNRRQRSWPVLECCAIL